MAMIIDEDGFTGNSQEDASGEETSIESSSSNLDVPPSLGASSESLYTEIDDGINNEQHVDPLQEDGFNRANPVSKVFWW